MTGRETAIRGAARDRLAAPERYPGLRPFAPDQRRLSLTLEPGHRPSIRWTVFAAADALVLRRVTWRPRPELHWPPETFGCDAILPLAVFEQVMAGLDALPHSSLPPPRVVIDGWMRGVERSAPAMTLLWGQDDPAVPEALQAWHVQTVEVFDSLLPAPSPYRALVLPT